jgi:hypothetical protein
MKKVRKKRTINDPAALGFTFHPSRATLPARVPHRSNAPALSLATLGEHPNADPVVQLLYAVLHARGILDRLDESIQRLHDQPQVNPTTGEPLTRRQARNMPDPLFFNPIGRQLFDYQHLLRGQLGSLAKQYVSLGIEERQTKVIEDWSNILLPFITALMDDPDLQLSRHQRHLLPQIVERHLRVLERPDALDAG